MDWIEIIGLFGAFLSSVTFIPQVLLAWKSKSVGDLSLSMILIVITSTVVWLIYGIALTLWPVIIANTIIFILASLLMIFKLSFKRSK